MIFQKTTVSFSFIKCIHLGKLKWFLKSHSIKMRRDMCHRAQKDQAELSTGWKESHDFVNNEKMRSYDHMEFIPTWNARINLWQVSFLQLQKHFQARPCSFSSYAQSVIHVGIFLRSDVLSSFLLKLVFWHFKILFLKIMKEKKNTFSDLPHFCCYIKLHSVSVIFSLKGHLWPPR